MTVVDHAHSVPTLCHLYISNAPWMDGRMGGWTDFSVVLQLLGLRRDNCTFPINPRAFSHLSLPETLKGGAGRTAPSSCCVS